MVVAMMIVVITGWGILLDRLVKLARRAVGDASATGVLNPAVTFCWVPLVTFAGVCYPQVFLGRDVVQKLARASEARWAIYIRMGGLGYLLLIFTIPLLFAILH